MPEVRDQVDDLKKRGHDACGDLVAAADYLKTALDAGAPVLESKWLDAVMVAHGVLCEIIDSDVGLETQAAIAKWAADMFGDPKSNVRIAARANEEMSELLRALTADDDNFAAANETADIVIVLYRLADRMGFDLHGEIETKMAINRKRVWDVDDGHGYHLRRSADGAA